MYIDVYNVCILVWQGYTDTLLHQGIKISELEIRFCFTLPYVHDRQESPEL